MIVISDTSPISNLAAIYQELLNSGNTDPAVLAIQAVNWVETRCITNIALVQTLQNNLDIGEAEAIILAVELNADRLIIDERRGRNEAIKLGLRVT